MSKVKSLSKLCRRMLGCDSLRCIASLKREHVRIRSTMQSFEILLDKMQYESRSAHTVSKEYLKDVQKFLKFNVLYSGQHRMKEDILYKHSINPHDNVCMSDKLHPVMDMKSEYSLDKNGQDKVNKVDNVLIPNKSHIRTLCDHIIKEDTVLLPEIIINLAESEMEQISQSFDQHDNKNYKIINAMEILSDELMSKYWN